MFAWGADRVLKLFGAAYQYAVDMEYERTRSVFDAGVAVLSPRGAVALDWVNAVAAHPATDVARSLLAMGYQGLTPVISAAERAVRQTICDVYLAAYLERSGIRRETVARCEPAMAATLLRGGPGNPEREALERIAAG